MASYPILHIADSWVNGPLASLGAWLGLSNGSHREKDTLTRLYDYHDYLYDQGVRALIRECDYPKAHEMFRRASEVTQEINDHRAELGLR